MPLYRKKPIIVDAEQYIGPAIIHSGDVIPESCRERLRWVYDVGPVRKYPVVVTAQGQNVKIWPGEWIIKESDGSGYYPCAPDIFAKTYDKVVETEIPEEAG